MILRTGSKLNSCVFSYSDVKLWLSFRIYADSTFNSTYEEYKVRVANTDSALKLQSDSANMRVRLIF